jgi:hypothetical protein
VIDSNEPIPTIKKFLQLLHAIFAGNIDRQHKKLTNIINNKFLESKIMNSKQFSSKKYFVNFIFLCIAFTASSLQAQTEDQAISNFIKENIRKPAIANAYAEAIDFDVYSRCMFISQVSSIEVGSISNKEKRMTSKLLWGMMNEGMKIAKSRLMSNGYSSKDIDGNAYMYMDVANSYKKLGHIEDLNKMTKQCRDIGEGLLHRFFK